MIGRDCIHATRTPAKARAFTAVYVGMGTVIAILTGRQYTRKLKHPPYRDNEND